MKIIIQRKIYNAATDLRNCIGELFIDGEYFCNTLEDEIRADGEKVYGKTAIPAGEYKVRIIWWAKHERYVPQIFNQEDFSVEAHGKKFVGILMHDGNTEADSLGCVLCAFDTDGNKIWNGASRALAQRIIDAGHKAELIIEDKIFAEGLTKTIIP